MLDFFDSVTKADRVMFLFLLSSDRKILAYSKSNSLHQIHHFATRPLTSSDAVAFVSERIQSFRTDSRPQFLLNTLSFLSTKTTFELTSNWCASP